MWMMFGWFSCAASLASSTNIVMNSSSSARCGRILLIATIFSKPSTPVRLALKTSAMPPLAMRSRISYWPNRSGPEDGTAASGSSRRRGSGVGIDVPAGGGVAPAGALARGREIPESVSERILSTSVSEESLGRGDEGAGAAAGFAGLPPRFKPDSVSRRRFSMSSLPARGGGPAGAAGGGCCGGGGAGGGALAAFAGGESTSSSRTSEKMSEDVSGVAEAASWAVSIRIVFAPMSDRSSASRTVSRNAASVNGRARMSNAPTFWASAFGLSPR